MTSTRPPAVQPASQASPIIRPKGEWYQYSFKKGTTDATWVLETDDGMHLQVALRSDKWDVYRHMPVPAQCEPLPLTYSLEEVQAYAIASFRMGK